MPHISKQNHGNLCSCRLLAQAVRCDPKVIRFEYCWNVLMKRWRVECNHGCSHEVPVVITDEKWHEFSPIDPVKVILIVNE